MITVKFSVRKPPNGDPHFLAWIDLPVIPRIDETVFYEHEGDDGATVYSVNNIIHHVKPKIFTEIWIVDFEDNSKIKDWL